VTWDGEPIKNLKGKMKKEDGKGHEKDELKRIVPQNNFDGD